MNDDDIATDRDIAKIRIYGLSVEQIRHLMRAFEMATNFAPEDAAKWMVHIGRFQSARNRKVGIT